MKKPIIHFVVSAIIGLGLGYVVFDVIADGNDKEMAVNNETTKGTTETKKDEQGKDTTETEQVSATGEENILQSKGCIGCHAVSGLNLGGGVTGPDLSGSYEGVEGKHGKPLDQFLKEPTSAVMATVIGGNPLNDNEIAQIVEELKKASESN